MEQSVMVSLGGGAGDQWIGLVGALVGAVLGAAGSGYASYVLQRREHDRADKLRQADTLARQRSTAHRLITSLIAVASDLMRLNEHFQKYSDAFERVDAWSVVTPLFQGSRLVSFDAEEQALLLDLGLAEAFNLVAPLPGIHQQLIEAMERYAAMREEMFDSLPPEAFRDDHIYMSREVLLKSEHRRSEMDAALKWMSSEVPSISSQSIEALTTSLSELKKHLSLNIDIDEKTRADGAAVGPNFQ